MGLSLTIDQGNSSAKVAVWDRDRLVELSTFKAMTDDVITNFAARYSIDKAIFSSVADYQDNLLSRLNAAGIKATELTHDTPLPLVIDYATPLTLGVDRIAAAVGAMSLHPGRELLVVDAGTAVTYDNVSADGHFIGGNIAPGIGLRLKALNAFTARLPLISGRGETVLWGNSTESAMRSGAVNGVIAEITYYHSRLSADAIVVLSGGWGHELAQKLDFETDYHESLVNRGLNEILKYNEID